MIHRFDLFLNANIGGTRRYNASFERSTCLSRGDLITVFHVEFDVNFAAKFKSLASCISTFIICPLILLRHCDTCRDDANEPMFARVCKYNNVPYNSK